jgi:hypothetical protein
VDFADTSLDEAIEARPFPTMAQGDQVFLALYELFFGLVVQWLYVPEPRAKAAVVPLRWPLEGVEFTSLHK